MITYLNEMFTVGQDVFFDCVSSKSSFGVVFEDDLRTGYFYAVDTKDGLKILDALHIYNVENVIDKNKPCEIQIRWSGDGQIAALLINNYYHAIFDFTKKAGYCRSGFPRGGNWVEVRNRLLTDDLIKELLNDLK